MTEEIFSTRERIGNKIKEFRHADQTLELIEDKLRNLNFPDTEQVVSTTSGMTNIRVTLYIYTNRVLNTATEMCHTYESNHRPTTIRQNTPIY